MSYIKSSEWVSPAHPDRVADVISATLINEIYKKDGYNGHAAIEIALFDNKVIVGGEVKTTLDFSSESLTPVARKAIEKIGYNEQLRKKFSKEDVYVAEDYEIMTFVNPQSPDIAFGTTDKVTEEKGWNDQGTYHSYASAGTPNRLSLEHYLATDLGAWLYNHALKSNNLGIDIKTLVQVEYDDKGNKKVSGVTIAVPTTREDATWYQSVKDIYNFWIDSLQPEYKNLFGNEFLIINGTGRYHRHGSLGDSGITGRKLIVNQCGNFAAGGSMIKPVLASDRLLNIYARHIAKTIVDAGLGTEVSVELSATIGQTALGSLRIIGCDNEKAIEYFKNKPVSPSILNKEWKTLEINNFDDVVFTNFFGGDVDIQPWEQTDNSVKELLEYLK